jgi:hypothetical protein
MKIKILFIFILAKTARKPTRIAKTDEERESQRASPGIGELTPASSQNPPRRRWARADIFLLTEQNRRKDFRALRAVCF